ncbi:hypothetical protein EV426DRAFT_683339 [Tirmania nivea]|nr:hypothetical protein EV426DRAFT_683339 [Tirmania nivea]
MDHSSYQPMAVLVPHTPSPPSSPPDARTPLRSGGSTYPWEAHHSYNSINKSRSYSPVTPRIPVQSPSQPPVYSGAVASSSPPQPQPPPATSPLSAPPLFLKQELEPDSWQTLYPSEIASFSPNTLRQKLTHSNSLLTRLSSSLNEARAQAAHFTFQHQLLTIETEEAMQRHQVEHEIAKREVEVLRGVGTGRAGAGAGGSMEQQRYAWALEEELAGYKRKLRRAKTLLREAREEVEQVRGENEMLKRRIAQNRARRMRDFEFEVGRGGVLQDGDDDDTFPEEGGSRIGNGIGVRIGIGNGVGYTREATRGSSSGPPTPRVQQHQYKYVENHYHSIYQQPTPQPSSSIGNTHNHTHSNHSRLPSSPPPIPPPHAYHSRLPQTPVTKPRRATTNNQNYHNSTHTSTSTTSASSSSALTTLGLLASQVLSQESFPTSQTSSHGCEYTPGGRPPRTTQQTAPRATTPVRSGGGTNTHAVTATTVPSTPISQARCHPGPVARGGRARGRRSGVNAPTKMNLVNQSESASADGLMATPKYTSPITHTNINTHAHTQPQHRYPPQSSPPNHLPLPAFTLTPTPRPKKRRLSSSSTLSLSNTNTNTTSTHDQDTASLDSEKERVLGGVDGFEDAEEDPEEKAYLAHLVHTGSPVPRGRKRGKVLGGNGGYVVRGGGAGVKKVRGVGDIGRGDR